MTRDTLIHEIHHDRTDVRPTFKEIREAVEKAETREDLTELYKQAVYMILMTHSSPLNEKDREMKRRRETTEREFARTVHLINERAKKMGVEAGFSEDWQRMATNSYESEEKSTLEPQNTVGIDGE